MLSFSEFIGVGKGFGQSSGLSNGGPIGGSRMHSGGASFYMQTEHKNETCKTLPLKPEHVDSCKQHQNRWKHKKACLKPIPKFPYAVSVSSPLLSLSSLD